MGEAEHTGTKNRKNADGLGGAGDVLKRMLDHTHVLVAYLDLDFNFVNVNRAYAEADERDPAFFPGKNHFDLYPNEENQAIFEQVVQTGIPYFAEAKPFEYADHPERGVSYWDWSLIPITNDDGTVGGLVLTIEDVTDRKVTELALRDSEAKFRRIFDHSRDGILLADSQGGRLLDANPAVCEMLGYSREELLKLDIDAIQGEPASSLIAMGQRAAGGSQTWMRELVFQTKTGDLLPLEASVSHVEIAGRKCSVAIFRNLIDRKDAEERLRNKAALVGSFGRVAHRLNAQLSLQGVLDAVCEETALGLRGAPVVVFIPDQAAGGLKPATGSGVPAELLDVSWPLAEGVFSENWEVDPDVVIISDFADEGSLLPPGFASKFDIRTAVFAPMRREDRIIGLLCVLALGRHRAFGEYELAMIEGLADQAAQAVEAVRLRDQERQMAVHEVRSQLAMDLHDSVAQALYGVTLSAQAAERMVDAGNIEIAHEQLRRIHEASRYALREMRQLIHELRPVELAEAGLEGALRDRLESVEKRSGIEVELCVDLEQPLDPILEEGLHRIAQEVLNNVVKHAQAQHVTVSIRCEDQKVILEITDDGIGFQSAEASEKGGLGIAGMQERARKMGGKLSIDSKPGKGTSARLEVDLPSGKSA